MTPRSRPARPRVLIAGGGVAGLETLLGLRALAGGEVDIELLSSEPEFVCRPLTVAEPFGLSRASRFALDAIAQDQGAGLRIGSLRTVDPKAHRALTAEGEEIEFDFLVVAAGARPIPGLPGALSFGAAGDVDAVRETMGEIGSSRFGSVAFALPPGISWPLPLYELALLAGTRVNAKGASGVTLTLATCEEQPLALFGTRVADAVRTLLTERGVRLRTSSRSFQVERGRLIIDGTGAVPADRVITLSGLVGPALPGLTQDESGFIPTDRHGRVHAAPDVYAAGDVTTFPLKQGGIAAQQANAVCHDIAARVGAPVQPHGFRAVVRGVLLTGAEPMRLGVEADLESPAVRDVDERLGGARGPTDTSSQEPDWHPTKIFGRYLGPYLAREQARSAKRSPGRSEREPASDDRAAEPLGFVLTMAEHDARSGNHALALHMLDAAEAVAGTLPAAFQDRRSVWLDELRRRQ